MFDVFYTGHYNFEESHLNLLYLRKHSSTMIFLSTNLRRVDKRTKVQYPDAAMIGI